ncbi:MAG TPA: trypsin-like peptidase domain-containing protein [Candidatus Eisenbacteria bacterium]|nr:trypsin-like peptidase domain-containing protein [Candidatus Eisenbacteria bacterium]
MRRWMAAAACAAALAAGGVDAAHAAAPAGRAEAAAVSLESLSRASQGLVARVAPAVVQIAVTAIGPVNESGAGDAVLGRQRRGGSGILVASDGYVLTNHHVIEGARQLQVLVRVPPAGSPNRSLVKAPPRRYNARLVGIDLETDLALLHIEATGLPFLPLGDSDQLAPGDLVLAFGSPLGLENSVTMGVVSAVGRQLRDEDPMAYIQTDTPINPGNSGGPLVDASGKVVGINTLIFTQSGGSEGIGFAVPSNIAAAVTDQIRRFGRVRRGVIGVEAQTITPLLASGLGLRKEWGVILSDVLPGSPAEAAGLRAGDVVESLDGKAMENGRQFDVNLYRRFAGDSVTVVVSRGGTRASARVRVAERPDDPREFASKIVAATKPLARIGVLAVDLAPALAAHMPWLREPEGVLVAAWSADDPSSASGLEPGDVIRALNGEPVATFDALTAKLQGMKPGAPAVLSVDRLGRRLFLPFELE